MPTFSNPRQILLLVLDVDGVLTDGSIWLGQDGYEMKRFHVRDGLGIKTWMKLGYHVAVISGRKSAAVQRRMDELGVTMVYLGIKNKAQALGDVMDRTGLSLSQIAHIGDDWPDIPVMRRVGYPIAVADAEGIVRRGAAYVTKRAGGQGAVREAIDHLLLAKGTTEDAQLEASTDGTEIFSPPPPPPPTSPTSPPSPPSPSSTTSTIFPADDGPRLVPER